MNNNFFKNINMLKYKAHLSLYNTIHQWVHVLGIEGVFQCRHLIYTAAQGPDIWLETEKLNP